MMVKTKQNFSYTQIGIALINDLSPEGAKAK
jgi:hypothetical protein